MYKSKSILAIIPARGGSKGVPGKNIRELSGKPLIAWTIEAALKSRYIDEAIVSTDDKKIASISKRHGVSVPFMRPSRFAADSTPMIEVVNHAIAWFEPHGQQYDIIALLQPTSPLRSVEDIDMAIELLFKKKAQSIVSICEVEHHPWLMNLLPKTKNMKNFLKAKAINKNRQDFPAFYRLNGAVYVAYVEYLKSNKSFFGDKTYAYEMPLERSIDIDAQFDFNIVEYMLSKQP